MKSHLRLSAWVLLAAGLCGAAAAQPAPVGFDWEAWGPAADQAWLLEGSELEFLVADPDGWLWAAGGGRLALIDRLGQQTVLGSAEGVPAGRLKAAAFGPEPAIAYLAFESGLYRLDGRRMLFTRVAEPGAPESPASLAAGGDGTIYAAVPGTGVLARAADGRWTSLPGPNRRVVLLRAAADGRVLALAPGDAWSLEGGTATRIPLPGRGDPIDAVLLAGGRAFILEADRLIEIPPSGEAVTRTGSPRWEGRSPTALGFDAASGWIWVGTREAGLFGVDAAGQVLQVTPEAGGLAARAVIGLAAGPQGGVVVGSAHALQVVRPAGAAPEPPLTGRASYLGSWHWSNEAERTVAVTLPRDHYEEIDFSYALIAPQPGLDAARADVLFLEDAARNRWVELRAPMGAVRVALGAESRVPGEAQKRIHPEIASPFPTGAPIELTPYCAGSLDRELAVEARVRLSPAGWNSMYLATGEVLASRFARLGLPAESPPEGRPLVQALRSGGDPAERNLLAISLLRGVGIPARSVLGVDGSLWGEAFVAKEGWLAFQAGAPVTAWGTGQRTQFPAGLTSPLLTVARVSWLSDPDGPISVSPPANWTRPAAETSWQDLRGSGVLVMRPSEKAGTEPPRPLIPVSDQMSLFSSRDGDGNVRLVLVDTGTGKTRFQIPLHSWGVAQFLDLPGAFRLEFIPSLHDELLLIRILSWAPSVAPPGSGGPTIPLGRDLGRGAPPGS